MTETEDGSAPAVWLLIDDRPGNRTQAVGAARALGWPAQEKRLVFNAKAGWPNPLLGATLSTLDEASRRLVAPPFPDMVIGVGKRVASVARWIKRESGGRTKVVLFGRKAPGGFTDLTVRLAYFEQAPDPGILELVIPTNQVDAEALAQARASQPDPMAGLARPRVVLLVGGPTGQHDFDAAFAERMARDIAGATAAIGGGLAIVTSRRTPEVALSALRRGAPAAQLHAWRADAATNPYLAYLANADLIVVTGESESMLAEAIATRRPVTIYPLLAKPETLSGRLRRGLATTSRGNGATAGIASSLLTNGWITPRRDFARMHDMLEQRGWARIFDGQLNQAEPAPHAEREELRRRLLALTTEEWRRSVR